MKIAFLADCHIGNPKRFGGPLKAGINTRGAQVLGALKTAYREAKKLGCEYVVIAGDLFDVSHPLPQHITAVQEVVKQIPSIILVGNHDQDSTTAGDHALGPLAAVPNVTVVEEPMVMNLSGKAQLWAVPFRPGPAMQWFPRILSQLDMKAATGYPRVLSFHLGIKDKRTPPWLEHANDAISYENVDSLCVKHGIAAAYCGNWHESRAWEFEKSGNPVWLNQIGALAPTGFDNPGLKDYGYMEVWDSADLKELTRVSIPGPRFLKSFDDVQTALKEGCQPYLELSVVEEDLQETSAELEKLNGKLFGSEIRLDLAEKTAAIRTAAGVARSAETVDEAVAKYIKEMPLPDEALRASVLERVTKFLKEAA